MDELEMFMIEWTLRGSTGKAISWKDRPFYPTAGFAGEIARAIWDTTPIRPGQVLAFRIVPAIVPTVQEPKKQEGESRHE